jgi:hypothetical protein
MSFWDVVWFIVISFAFVAYLMVMFSIVGDLFRDRETSGVAKGGLGRRADSCRSATRSST